MEDSVVSRMEKNTCQYQESTGYYRSEGVASACCIYMYLYGNSLDNVTQTGFELVIPVPQLPRC